MKNKLKFIIPIVIAVIAIIIAALCINFTPQERADVSSLMSTAQKYLIENQYEQAIAEFNKVIEIEPKNVDAYLGLAEAYIGMGDTDKAIEILEKGYASTNDERLKKMLNSLSENNIDVTIALQRSDSESILFYSDGTVRCQKTFLSDGGYKLEWFEPNAHCMLTETYDSADKIIYAKYYGSFEENSFIVEAVPELSENSYIISSDYIGGIKYEFNFDGKLIKTIDSLYASAKRVISYEYPSEKKIIADFSYNYNNFYSYTKEQIEYIDNGKIKTTYFRDDFTLGYSITEMIDEKTHRISYYEEDNTLVGYRNLEYTDALNKMTMYSADGILLSEGEYKKDGYKNTTYDLDGKVYSTNSAEYKDNKYVSHFDDDMQYEITTEGLSDGSIKRTYNGYMYDEREVEIEKYTDNGYTTTRYDKDGNVISVTTYENNSRTEKYTNYNGNNSTVYEWISSTQNKLTHYDENGNMTGYSLLNYNSPMYMFLGINYVYTDKYYSPNGSLKSENEYDVYGSGKGTFYNDDGTVSGTYVATRSNGIYYRKYYTADGKIQQESEEDRKGNSKGTYYNSDGTVSGTYVATRSNGVYYTKNYNADGTFSYESENDNKGNYKSTGYYPNGAISYISIGKSDGTHEYYSYDENGKLVSHNKYDKNGNEIS